MMKNLNYTLGDTVNQVQKGVLHDIAHACPVEHGHAVYAARSFISIIYPGILTSYINCDGGQNLIRKGISGLTENGKPLLYPNPTSEYVNIKFEIINNNHTLVIYDLTGRIIYQNLITNSILDIRNIHPGTYIYRIHCDNLTTDTGRFIIIK
jgi:hypothetical protein